MVCGVVWCVHGAVWCGVVCGDVWRGVWWVVRCGVWWVVGHGVVCGVWCAVCGLWLVLDLRKVALKLQYVTLLPPLGWRVLRTETADSLPDSFPAPSPPLLSYKWGAKSGQARVTIVLPLINNLDLHHVYLWFVLVWWVVVSSV